jgi:hypothetical protein
MEALKGGLNGAQGNAALGSDGAVHGLGISSIHRPKVL